MYGQMSELREEKERGSKYYHDGLAPDAQEGKRTKERGYETGRKTCGIDRRSVVAVYA